MYLVKNHPPPPMDEMPNKGLHGAERALTVINKDRSETIQYYRILLLKLLSRLWPLNETAERRGLNSIAPLAPSVVYSTVALPLAAFDKYLFLKLSLGVLIHFPKASICGEITKPVLHCEFIPGGRASLEHFINLSHGD